MVVVWGCGTCLEVFVVNIGGIDEYMYAEHFVFEGKFKDFGVLFSCH